MDRPAGALRADPLHSESDPDTHWSTGNVGEAMPGVASPLCWSAWSQTNRMCCEVAYAMGVFTRAERTPARRAEDRLVSLFYGRMAIRVEWVALLGDRMPGTTGYEAVNGFLGDVPSTLELMPTRRRYPVIAWRLPAAGVAGPVRIRRLAPRVETWWRQEIARLPDADRDRAASVLVEALRRFADVMTLHGVGLFAAITPLVTTLTRLVERTGVGDVGLLSGTGGAEMAMVEDIWKASRGEIPLSRLVADHGYHGPFEGELSSTVWREDPSPLESMVRQYAARPDSDSPARIEAAARERLPVMQRELCAALPVAQRPAVRALLWHAERTVPLRGVGKVSFLQALDVARAAARRIGAHLCGERLLDDPDDVFYLVLEELTGPLPRDAKDLVATRRARRAEYQRLVLPPYWRGEAIPETVDRQRSSTGADGSESADPDDVVTGIGVSSGVVEGIACVVTDPSFADVEPGQVLVAATTDPSWASIMFVSSALVVDIGSMLSHASVVARELGVPCVTNTRVGTRRIRDGDLVRVDGSAGTVEIIKRAG